MKNFLIKNKLTLKGSGGGGGGGGGQTIIVSAPAAPPAPPVVTQYPSVLAPPQFSKQNTISSFSYAELIDLLCDGPIEGLINNNGKKLYDENIFEGIYLNDTSIKETSIKKSQSIPISFIKERLKLHWKKNNSLLINKQESLTFIQKNEISDANFLDAISIKSYHPDDSIYEYVNSLNASLESVALIQRAFDLSPVIDEKPFLTKINIPYFKFSLSKEDFDASSTAQESFPLKMDMVNISEHIYFSITNNNLNSFNYFELPRSFVSNNALTSKNKKTFKKNLISSDIVYTYEAYDINIYIWSIYNENFGIKNIDNVLDLYLNKIFVNQENASLYNYNLVQSEFKNGSEVQTPLQSFSSVQIDTDYSKELIGPFKRIGKGVQRISDFTTSSSSFIPATTTLLDEESSSDCRSISTWPIEYDREGRPTYIRNAVANYSVFDKTSASRIDQEAVPITHYISNQNVEEVFVTLGVNQLYDTNHIDMISQSFASAAAANFGFKSAKADTTDRAPLGMSTFAEVLGTAPLDTNCFGYLGLLIYGCVTYSSQQGQTYNGYIIDGDKCCFPTNIRYSEEFKADPQKNIKRITSAGSQDTLYYKAVSEAGLSSIIPNYRSYIGEDKYDINENNRLYMYNVPNENCLIQPSFKIDSFSFDSLNGYLKSLNSKNSPNYSYSLEACECITEASIKHGRALSDKTIFSHYIETEFTKRLSANLTDKSKCFYILNIPYNKPNDKTWFMRATVAHSINRYIDWSAIFTFWESSNFLGPTNKILSSQISFKPGVDKYKFPNIFKYIINPFINLNTSQRGVGVTTNWELKSAIDSSKEIIGNLYLLGLNGSYIRSQASFFNTNGLFHLDALEKLMQQFLIKDESVIDLSAYPTNSNINNSYINNSVEVILRNISNSLIQEYNINAIKYSYINEYSNITFSVGNNPNLINSTKTQYLPNNINLYRSNNNLIETQDLLYDVIIYYYLYDRVANAQSALPENSITAKFVRNTSYTSNAPEDLYYSKFANASLSITAGTKIPAIVSVKVETGYENQENEINKSAGQYFQYLYTIYGLGSEGALLDIGRNNYDYVVSSKRSLNTGKILFSSKKSDYFDIAFYRFKLSRVVNGVLTKSITFITNTSNIHFGEMMLRSYFPFSRSTGGVQIRQDSTLMQSTLYNYGYFRVDAYSPPTTFGPIIDNVSSIYPYSWPNADESGLQHYIGKVVNSNNSLYNIDEIYNQIEKDFEKFKITSAEDNEFFLSAPLRYQLTFDSSFKEFVIKNNLLRKDFFPSAVLATKSRILTANVVGFYDHLYASIKNTENDYVALQCAEYPIRVINDFFPISENDPSIIQNEINLYFKIYLTLSGTVKQAYPWSIIYHDYSLVDINSGFANALKKAHPNDLIIEYGNFCIRFSKSPIKDVSSVYDVLKSLFESKLGIKSTFASNTYVDKISSFTLKQLTDNFNDINFNLINSSFIPINAAINRDAFFAGISKASSEIKNIKSNTLLSSTTNITQNSGTYYGINYVYKFPEFLLQIVETSEITLKTVDRRLFLTSGTATSPVSLNATFGVVFNRKTKKFVVNYNNSNLGNNYSGIQTPVKIYKLDYFLPPSTLNYVTPNLTTFKWMLWDGVTRNGSYTPFNSDFRPNTAVSTTYIGLNRPAYLYKIYYWNGNNPPQNQIHWQSLLQEYQVPDTLKRELITDISLIDSKIVSSTTSVPGNFENESEILKNIEKVLLDDYAISPDSRIISYSYSPSEEMQLTEDLVFRRYSNILITNQIFQSTDEINSFSKISIPPPKNDLNGFPIRRYVKITKVSAETLSPLISKKISLNKVTEIINQKFSYPFSSIVGMRLDARAFSSIPARTYHCKLKKILVPSNYFIYNENQQDVRYIKSQTKPQIYIGDWDGSFKLAWSNNPAWILMDILINKRYGLGNYIESEQVDIWELYKIARWCDCVDELGYYLGVPDSYGGIEPRHAFNGIINDKFNIFDMINQIASIFRGHVYYMNSFITFDDDRIKPIVGEFNNLDVKDGIFNYTNHKKDDEFTAVDISYVDEKDNYKPKIEYVEDYEAIRQKGILKKQINAFGITSRGQAIRFAKHFLQQTAKENLNVSFTTDLKALLYKPGDLVKINDELLNNTINFGVVKDVENIDQYKFKLVLDKKFDSNMFDLSSVSLYMPIAKPKYDDYINKYRSTPSKLTFTLASPMFQVTEIISTTLPSRIVPKANDSWQYISLNTFKKTAEYIKSTSLTQYVFEMSSFNNNCCVNSFSGIINVSYDYVPNLPVGIGRTATTYTYTETIKYTGYLNYIENKTMDNINSKYGHWVFSTGLNDFGDKLLFDSSEEIKYQTSFEYYFLEDFTTGKYLKYTGKSNFGDPLYQEINFNPNSTTNKFLNSARNSIFNFKINSYNTDTISYYDVIESNRPSIETFYVLSHETGDYKINNEVQNEYTELIVSKSGKSLTGDWVSIKPSVNLNIDKIIAGTNYSLNLMNKNDKVFKIMSITENYINEYNIFAVEYNLNKFKEIEESYFFDNLNDTFNVLTRTKNVELIKLENSINAPIITSLEHRSYRDNTNQILNYLELCWSATVNAIKYKIYIKTPSKYTQNYIYEATYDIDFDKSLNLFKKLIPIGIDRSIEIGTYTVYLEAINESNAQSVSSRTINILYY